MSHVFSEANFDSEVLQSPIPVVVDFWAEWCGPCKMMSPVLDQIAEEMDATKIKIGKVNVDENQPLAMKYNIMSIPAFLIFKNGQVIDQIIGGMPKDRFKEKLSSYLV